MTGQLWHIQKSQDMMNPIGAQKMSSFGTLCIMKGFDYRFVIQVKFERPIVHRTESVTSRKENEGHVTSTIQCLIRTFNKIFDKIKCCLLALCSYTVRRLTLVIVRQLTA